MIKYIKACKNCNGKHKQCVKCGNWKNLEDFPKDRRALYQVKNKCRICTNESRNKNKHNGLSAIYQEVLQNIKVKNGCCVCGIKETIPALYDFHHIDKESKLFAISSITNKHSLEEIVKELNKCAVLCANCHRKTHYLEFRDENKYKSIISMLVSPKISLNSFINDVEELKI